MPGRPSVTFRHRFALVQVGDDLSGHYLEQAARIRAEAERATIPDIKNELLKIAAAFERLANRAKHPVR